MKQIPDLSALLGDELDLPRANPSSGVHLVAPANITETATERPSSDGGTRKPENSKRKRDGDRDSDAARIENKPSEKTRNENRDVSPGGSRSSKRSGDPEGASKERPKKKKKTSDRKATTPRESKTRAEDDGENAGAATEERNVPVIDTVVPQVAKPAADAVALPQKPKSSFRNRVDFHFASDSPLINNPDQCAALVRQVKGGPKDMPGVNDLVFADAYTDAARSMVLGQARMNFLVQEYDSALKNTIAQLKKAEATIASRDDFIEKKKKEIIEASKIGFADRDRAIARYEAEKKKSLALASDLEAACKALKKSEQEKAVLASEKEKEAERFRRSRSYAVLKERSAVEAAMSAKCARRFENIRSYLAKREAYDAKCQLLGQASGTRKCLEMLKGKGIDIPQAAIDLFSSKEAQYQQEAAAIEVGDLPESDLSLSPMALPSSRSTERQLTVIDPFGSNMNAGGLSIPSADPRVVDCGTSQLDMDALAGMATGQTDLLDRSPLNSSSAPPDGIQIEESQGIPRKNPPEGSAARLESDPQDGIEEKMSELPMETQAQDGSQPPAA